MKRRNFIQETASLAIGTTVLPSFYIGRPKPTLSEAVIGHGDFRYKVHKNWGNLDSSTHPVKDCHEMVMDSKGRLIMVGNHTRNNILIYDKSGKLLDFWGIRYVAGHGLTLWNDGEEDFLFIADAHWGSTKGGPSSVVKTTTYGREIMKIEHPSHYGAYPEDLGWSPTETAVAPNGDIYIADGYGACYILQFNHKGEFIRKFGGKGDGEDQLLTAHGVCIDNRDKDHPTVLATSRATNCFKRFTLDGKYLETIQMPAAYVCRPVIDGENIYAGVCWSTPNLYNPEDSNTHPVKTSPNSGFVTILNKEDTVVSNPGGTAPEYKKGFLQPMLQKEEVFMHCHDVCVDEDKNLYICQWNAQNTYPIKLERI
ncbi:MAG: 6-bladed beta-propeller [Bacteroidota bacterium]